MFITLHAYHANCIELGSTSAGRSHIENSIGTREVLRVAPTMHRRGQGGPVPGVGTPALGDVLRAREIVGVAPVRVLHALGEGPGRCGGAEREGAARRCGSSVTEEKPGRRLKRK